jgi:hypothetical protein
MLLAFRRSAHVLCPAIYLRILTGCNEVSVCSPVRANPHDRGVFCGFTPVANNRSFTPVGLWITIFNVPLVPRYLFTMSLIEPRSSSNRERQTPVAGGDENAVSPRNLDAPFKPKKPLSFYMSVVTLCLLALTTAWDATALAIALPVSPISATITSRCLKDTCP